jgi:hypothetical protein
MINIIQTAEHAYASAARDSVKAWRFVHDKVIPLLKHAQADEGLIESVTKMVDPEAENIERTAFAILGMFLTVCDKLPEANGGANVLVDAQIISQLKSFADVLKTKIHPATLANTTASATVVPATPAV